MTTIETGGIFLVNKYFELLVCHPTKHPDNFWSIPKGKVDDGEDFLTCALRELHEESNVDLINIPIKLHLLKPQTFNNKRKRLNSFLILEIENNIPFNEFDLKCNNNVEPDKGGFPEMDDFMWVNIFDIKVELHPTQILAITEIKKLINEKFGWY